MKRVKIAELKDRLSSHLREVERGAEIEVTDRSRPIARVVPIAAAPARPTVVGASVPFSSIRDRRVRAAHWEMTSLELLAEERGRR